jgi:hypothetical protein
VMKTIGADIQEETNLLVQGAKGKINDKEITDTVTAEKLKKLALSFLERLNKSNEDHQ